MFVQDPERRKRKNKSRLFAVLTVLGLLLLTRNITATKISAIENFPPATLAEQLEQTNDYLQVIEGAPNAYIYSKNYLLMDGSNGDILISKGADEPIAVASTTKMVTALTAIELLDLDDVAIVSQKPPLIEGSKVGLKAGEKITISDLLKGLLISSGNDTAFAIAEAYAQEPGNYAKFVEQMNKFVASKNLTISKFADPAGLDDDNGRSTGRELAHIARLVLQNETLSSIVRMPSATIASVDGRLVHELDSTNRLIKAESGYYLPNALGVKTGFTHGAGHSLVAAYKFGDRNLIGVVMNTAEYTNTASAEEMKKLFTWADRYVVKASY